MSTHTLQTYPHTSVHICCPTDSGVRAKQFSFMHFFCLFMCTVAFFFYLTEMSCFKCEIQEGKLCTEMALLFAKKNRPPLFVITFIVCFSVFLQSELPTGWLFLTLQISASLTFILCCIQVHASFTQSDVCTSF